jgi:hypothetical protein
MMRRAPHRLQALAATSAALAIGLAVSPAAEAAWSSTGAGTASSLAGTMPSGGTPSARAASGNVTVQWPAALLSDGVDAGGYVVHRFSATTGVEATVGAGCSGVVTATTCVELSVPSGAWIYTVATAQDNWSGAQGPPSTTVSVP